MRGAEGHLHQNPHCREAVGRGRDLDDVGTLPHALGDPREQHLARRRRREIVDREDHEQAALASAAEQVGPESRGGDLEIDAVRLRQTSAIDRQPLSVVGELPPLAGCAHREENRSPRRAQPRECGACRFGAGMRGEIRAELDGIGTGRDLLGGEVVEADRSYDRGPVAQDEWPESECRAGRPAIAGSVAVTFARAHGGPP